jgi:hypothetical protein
MRYLQISLALFFTFSLVGNSFWTIAHEKRSFQQQTQFANESEDEIEDYQYTIGFRLATAFSDNCSFLIGSVDNFIDQKVELIIEEQLWGKKIDEPRVELNYVTPRTDFRTRRSARSPWDYVNVQKGNKLFVTLCNSSGLRRNWVVISDETLFSTVRELIKYHDKFQQNPDIILAADKLLAKQDNFIFAGYVTTYLRGGVFSRAKNTALVFSQLLGNSKVPKTTWAFAQITLRSILTREGEKALTNETRDLVISRVVDLGSSDNKAAEQAIRLLVSLAEKDKIDLKSFLDKEKRDKLRQNYQKLDLKYVSELGKQKFEKLLSENNF